MKTGVLSICLAGAWALAACAPGERPAAVKILALEAGAGSLAPHFCEYGDSLYLSWVEPQSDSSFALKYSRWSGSHWDHAAVVAEGSKWVVHWADIPQLQVHSGGFTAIWLERMGAYPHAYGARFLRLGPGLAPSDSGTWLHDDTSGSEHGFVSLVPLAGGAVQAVWLDGRETVRDGPTTLRTRLLTEQGGPGAEMLLDERVCDCCPTSAVRCSDGSLLVAYRDRSADEVRDISVTRLVADSWSAPRSVYRDEWKIAGCPVNGPALAASDSLVALAWFTMSGGVDPTVNVCFSGDCGRAFGAPVRVDQRHAEGRVDVTWLEDGRACVVWMEATDSASTLWARALSPGGRADTAVLLASGAPGEITGIPAVASAGEMAIAAWTESSETSRVRAVTFRP